jgi:hypothetical protein
MTLTALHAHSRRSCELCPDRAFFSTHTPGAVEERGPARAGLQARVIGASSSAGVAPPSWPLARRRRGRTRPWPGDGPQRQQGQPHEPQARRRQLGRWLGGDTHTHAPHHRSCATAVQLIRESRICQELCQPSALPPATVALHASLPPVIPPGTELDISAADALPTEAEVRPAGTLAAEPSPHA